MTRQDFIGEYVERHKKKLQGLEYGMEYLNKLANLEERADKLWDNRLKREIKENIFGK